MATKLPYVTAYGNITKALEKLQTAATPPRFTQDFLATKLSLKGGSPKPVIPFLKRTGFLGGDGVPTELYKKFRNADQRGPAAAAALKTGYAPLYEINEYIHDAKDSELKGAVVQVTGLAADSGAVRSIVGSFLALRQFASFEETGEATPETDETTEEFEEETHRANSGKDIAQLGLSYTINLNLPATSDIAVFDAIFKSLRANLLK